MPDGTSTTSSPAPLATVLVSTVGDRRTRRLLASLDAQSAAAESFEIIVIENGGTTALADVSRTTHPAIRYFTLQERNLAAARDFGARAARGRFLLMTDDDCIADARWVEAHCAALEAGEVSITGGRIVKHSVNTWVQRHAITVVDGQSRFSYLPFSNLPYVAGANCGLVRQHVIDVGSFDPRYLSGSDVDICYRLGARGFRAGLVPDAVIAHEDRTTLRAHFRRFRHYAIYQALLYKEHRQTQSRIFVDTYPFRRLAQAVGMAFGGGLRVIRGDSSLLSRAFLQSVEAAAVFVGDLEGSWRFRCVYL